MYVEPLYKLGITTEYKVFPILGEIFQKIEQNNTIYWNRDFYLIHFCYWDINLKLIF